MSHHAEFSRSTSGDVSQWQVENACALAERLGFERVPPATYCALYERGDAALLLYRPPYSNDFQFILAADEDVEFTRLSGTFGLETGGMLRIGFHVLW